VDGFATDISPLVFLRAAAGFLSYEDFQSQALGVGAAVSAVTLLFWVAVLLLVVSCRPAHCAYSEWCGKLHTTCVNCLLCSCLRAASGLSLQQLVMLCAAAACNI
jgi:hypothetical protein